MNTVHSTCDAPGASSEIAAPLALILERLEAIESKLSGKKPERVTRAGRVFLTNSEYEEKYGVPRVTMAVALVMTGERTLSVIADRIFVHRWSLTKSAEFKTFRA